MRYLRKRHDISDERGFTLLELLVAMIVLTILAGIAVPVFYHQRRKGWVAHVHSALTHMARAENHYVYGGDGSTFTVNVDDLVATGFRFNDEYVEPLVLAADSQTFCIQMTSAKDHSIVWHYNSQVGRPEEGPGTDAACGLPPGTLVAGEFDTDDNDPNDPDGTDTLGRTDTDGDGIPDDEDPTPGGNGNPNTPVDPPGGGPSGDPGASTGGDPDTSGGDPVTDPTITDTDGDGDLDPPVTQDDPSDDVTPGRGNNGGGGGDGGCRGDRNDPDDDANGGRDEIGGVGGSNDDRDCDNGSGNDSDDEDDNNGGGKKR